MFIEGVWLNTRDFEHLDSLISNSSLKNEETYHRINGDASAAFSQFRMRVFQNRDLHLKTRVNVYRAVCASTLLYSAESGTL